MKKFLIAIAVIIAASLGCKKAQLEPGLCACSPVVSPYLSLVLKNNAGQDLLNPTTPGAIATSKIQLYQLQADGKMNAINFALTPPFSYGTDKFDFYQLSSQEIVSLAGAGASNFYLKIDDALPVKLTVELHAESKKVVKLFFDGKEAPAEAGSGMYGPRSIFYLSFS